MAANRSNRTKKKTALRSKGKRAQLKRRRVRRRIALRKGMRAR